MLELKKHKRFILFISILIFLYMFFKITFLDPCSTEARGDLAQTQRYQSLLNELYSRKIPPDEKTLLAISEQHNTLSKEISVLCEEARFTKSSTDAPGEDITYFRELHRKEVQSLTKRAGTLGIVLDEEALQLGFQSGKIKANEGKELRQYYNNLDLAVKVTDVLLNLAEKEKKVRRILYIRHPELFARGDSSSQKEEDGFICPVPIEVCFEGNMEGVMEAIHCFSQKRKFLSITKAKLESIPEEKNDVLNVTLTLEKLIINPEGKPIVPQSPSSKPSTGWQRY